jgi:hypothetical protein
MAGTAIFYGCTHEDVNKFTLHGYDVYLPLSHSQTPETVKVLSIGVQTHEFGFQ